MAKPIVAIVGRPNVASRSCSTAWRASGFPSLRIRRALPATVCTLTATGAVANFTVIDTGGIEPSNDNEILQFMRFQAETAISHADVIILITDLRTGITAADQDVASMLLRSGKPLVLAVNKCDKPGDPPAEFYESTPRFGRAVRYFCAAWLWCR